MSRQRKRSAFGSIFQRRGRAGYYVRVRYKGREIVRYAGSDRRTAAEYQAQLLRRLTREDLLGERTLASVTFAEFEPMLLQSLRARHASTTYAAELGRAKRAREHFRSTPLKDIGPADIESFLSDLRNEHGFSIAAVNRYASLLSIAFKLAVHKGFAASNPLKDIDRAREPQRAVPFLSSDDVTALVTAASDRRFGCLLRVLADTGLRRSEALALAWGDVDFARRCILVRESKNRHPRQVELTDAALEAFRRLKSASARDSETLVWPEWQERGAQAVSSRFKTIARRSGRPSLRLHDLRHAFCSRLAQAGVPLPTIATLAGHTTWLTTQRYASHLPEGATRAAIASMQRKEECDTDRRRYTSRRARSPRSQLLLEGSHPSIALSFASHYRELPFDLAPMLEFTFRTREIRAICEQDTAAAAQFGPAVAAALRKRLADLAAASHAFELPVGDVRLDPSCSDGTVCLVDLDAEWVLRFRVGHADIMRKPDGTVDWGAVSRIQVVEVLRR